MIGVLASLATVAALMLLTLAFIAGVLALVKWIER